LSVESGFRDENNAVLVPAATTLKTAIITGGFGFSICIGATGGINQE
jgi:hypothetical protein